MMKIKLSRHQRIGAVLTWIFAMALLSNPANVSSSWWDKGKGLLESISKGDNKGSLTTEDIGQGLKEALRVGSENVVARLGRADGFNADSQIHIPLPEKLHSVKSALAKVGMSAMLDDLELKLNRAAEVATPKATNIFKQAITAMRFEDVKAIFNGPKDAATQYFRTTMSPSLTSEMRPIVDNSLLEVGAVNAYDKAMKTYQALPFVPDVKSNLSDYVIQKGIDGIFFYMAKEEAAIRDNPAKRTTALLKRIFGQ